MKRLIIDIETTPNLADVWGLWNQNISITQLRVPTRMLCFAAKWHGEKNVMFRDERHDPDYMRSEVRSILDEADTVIHYNGTTFDIPHIRRELIEAGFDPPSPFRQIDLCNVAKKQFRFASNKLDHVAPRLGLGGKIHHTGHELWQKCMAGDERAWALMKRYNIGDVRLTEKLYDRLLPWIPGHPHMGLYADPEKTVCSRCGSDKIVKDGIAYTPLSAFQRWRCGNCGACSRSGKRIAAVDVRGIQ